MREYDEDDFLIACALRFDGYKYLEKRNAQNEADAQDFASLGEKVMQKREFHGEQLDNFAVFFSLQRFLYKWGGERLTVYSDEHTTFRLLFLHLYREDVPPEFRLENEYRIWRDRYEPVRETLAAQIRRNLRRVGRGAKIQK